jgi:hypothetical protein
MSKILLSAIISLPLIFGQFFFTNVVNPRSYSTTAIVALVGAKIAAQKDVVKKYKRKDCPVCKGKGWYISGDGIAKISCQYCE